jgi:hypothetical protein
VIKTYQYLINTGAAGDKNGGFIVIFSISCYGIGLLKWAAAVINSRLKLKGDFGGREI